jgi:hypothetical protein
MDVTPSALGRELDFPTLASPVKPLGALESLGVPALYKDGAAVYRCNDPADYYALTELRTRRAIVLRGVRSVQIFDRPALTLAQ